MTISLKEVEIDIVNIYKPHGNHKSKIYNNIRERNTSTQLEKIIKPQGKKLKEEEKKREAL